MFSGRLFIKPGSILFILILYLAYSFENNFVNEDKLARNTLEVGKTGSGSKVAKLEIFIIEPFFCFFIIGVTILVALTTFKK